jgi:hypothetical protein
MRVMLRYAFESGTCRVGLIVFEYNRVGARMKVGFQYEGVSAAPCAVKATMGLLHMGILRHEWQRMGGG